jgi:hypothetical protein
MKAKITQQYLNLIKPEVSEHFYKVMQGDVDFVCHCKNQHFSVITIGNSTCNIIVPTSAVVIL